MRTSQMTWLLGSIAASLIAGCGPLLMVESVSAIRRLPILDAPRRRLRVATAIALSLVGTWLVIDRDAVAAGMRSFPVAGVAATMFAVLFVTLGYPILQRAAVTPGLIPPSTPSAALLRSRWDAAVLVALLASLAAFGMSPNDLGYRIKGLAIVLAGGALYFLGRPRASGTFGFCAFAGAVTLFAQWEVPWQRAVGTMSQLSVGVIGLVWCARVIVRSESARAFANRAVITRS